MPGIKEDLSKKIPDLKNVLKVIIDESEKEFSKKKVKIAQGFLWEHTLHVAAITKKISKLEEIDSSLPEIMALFHDTGKFKEGVYHTEDIPEEKIAAEIAEKVLNEFEFNEQDIAKVTEGLLSLYDEKRSGNKIADIIHDADFLSKFGSLGVAVFFTKMVLRGNNINDSVLNALSKELTYASILPQNMRTVSGRKLAEKKSKRSIKFFKNLINELKEDGIDDFLIRKKKWTCKDQGKKGIDVYMVIRRKCNLCGAEYKSEFAIEKGIKCQKLNLEIKCVNCPDKYKTSFCLPEII